MTTNYRLPFSKKTANLTSYQKGACLQMFCAERQHTKQRKTKPPNDMLLCTYKRHHGFSIQFHLQLMFRSTSLYLSEFELVLSPVSLEIRLQRTHWKTYCIGNCSILFKYFCKNAASSQTMFSEWTDYIHVRYHCNTSTQFFLGGGGWFSLIKQKIHPV